jgi:serralysin
MTDFVVSRDTGISSFFLNAGETGIILANGAITAPLFPQAAIQVFGNGANIANFGAIASPHAAGISVTARAVRIINDGLIAGFGAGISGSGNAQIDNSGTITALAGANARAISLTGGGSLVANSGTLLAPTAEAIFLDGGGNSILNTGIIRTGGAQAILFGLGSDTVINNGTIIGSISFGDGSARLVNSGLIDGNIFTTGKAAALFDLRGGGSVTGTLTGGGLNDTLRGGQDVERFFGGFGNDLANAAGGNDTLAGEGANDTLRGGSGDDALSGGSGTDSLDGGGDDDSLSGGSDADRLQGGSGDDTLNGDAGADRLNGGSGDDVLRGGTGQDLLTGGSGSDLFIFATTESAPGTADTIADFDANHDQIDLQAASAQVLLFRGTGSFAGGGTASLTYAAAGGNLRLHIDTNGDSLPDMQILLTGLASITANSFLL